jgi:hypothetical protein
MKVGQSIDLDMPLKQVVKFEAAQERGDTLAIERLEKEPQEQPQRSRRVRIVAEGEEQPEDKRLQVQLKSRKERTPKSDAALAVLERAPELAYHEVLEQATSVLGADAFGEPRPQRARIIESLRNAAK